MFNAKSVTSFVLTNILLYIRERFPYFTDYFRRSLSIADGMALLKNHLFGFSWFRNVNFPWRINLSKPIHFIRLSAKLTDFEKRLHRGLVSRKKILKNSATALRTDREGEDGSVWKMNGYYTSRSYFLISKFHFLFAFVSRRFRKTCYARTIYQIV